MVIADDERLRTQIAAQMGERGFRVTASQNPSAAVGAFARDPAQIVICDVDLRGDNGYSIVSRLRAKHDARVIMLMASNRREDRMLALSLGIDHVLVKPVDLHELGIIVRNLEDRIGGRMLSRAVSVPVPASALPDRSPQPQQHWLLNVLHWTLTAPNGGSVQLSMSDCIVLQELLDRAGLVASRDELTQALAQSNIRVYARNLDALISRLRRKVERGCGGNKLPLLSARNIGYVFTGACQVVQAGSRPLYSEQSARAA